MSFVRLGTSFFLFATALLFGLYSGKRRVKCKACVKICSQLKSQKGDDVVFVVVMAIQVVGIITLVAEIMYLFTRNPSRLQIALLAMTICALVNFVGETAEILSTNPESALMAVRLSYLGKPFILYTCFLFLVSYCRIRVPRWLMVVLFVIQASVSVMAFTCPYHSLYYTSIAWTEQGIFPHLVLGKSVLYWIYSAIIVLYLIAFVVLIVRQLRRSTTESQRRQAINLIAMMVVMAATLIIYLMGVTGGYDLTLVGYTISVVFLSHAILRYNLFETLTLARERALQDSNDGLFVFDQRGDLIFANAMAYGLARGLDLDLGEPAVGPEPTVFDGDKVARLVANLDELAKQNAPLETENGFYETRLRELAEGDVPYGRIYEVKDVTESHTYSLRLERDVETKTHEIREMQRDIIVGFANMVEARDDVTGAHVKNTSAYVGILTRSLQRMVAVQADGDVARMVELWGPGYEDALDPSFLEMVVEVAPLHDLGKIAVSDAILRKPGKLTDEEFDIMKEHTTKGVEVIEKTLRGIETDEYVRMAKQVAGGHHEKWNGKGYPSGLAGADIPLAARIMAIADVYDALLSERSYKPAFSHEKAHDIIVGDAGTHFDPVLVEAFEAALSEMEAV